MDEAKLTLQELETHLWKSADILRGSIDSADYKHYIFGLLFLKRMTDVFIEEATKLELKYKNKKLAWNDPDMHSSFVPETARWESLQKVTTDIGAELDKATAAIEGSNKSLEGVLQNIVFNDKDKLSDKTLGDLIKHYSKIPLGNNNLSDPDMLGRAYEYLIKMFADDAGKKGGEFYTPRQVVKLIVNLLKPKEGMRINDPTVGSGGFLINTIHYLREQRKSKNGKDVTKPINMTLTGQEKNTNTWTICKMNLLLHGLPDARIEKGDTIRNPKLLENNQLMKFDRIMANPPFSLKNWGYEEAKADNENGYRRFKFGIPPKSYGDLAFVQHMYATLNDTGILAVVMPHGVLFRSGAEGKIRRSLIEADAIEAIIGLPANIFYGTGIPACIIIINKAKSQNRKNKIVFIHAVEEYEDTSPKNYLRDQDVRKIYNTFETIDQRQEIERYARIVDIDEIVENNFSLNITQYIDTLEPEKEIYLDVAIKEWKMAVQEQTKSKNALEKKLLELGFS